MNRDGAHDPRAIANKVLDIRAETGEPLSLMQLIKLVYIADGWSLALLGKPLSSEPPQAWQYGPVYRTLYNAFSGIGARPVSSRALVGGTDIPISDVFDENEDQILRMVVQAYGKLSAFALSNLTHQKDTPWSKAHDRGLYTEIEDSEMLAHFNSLKEKRLVKKAD